MPWAALVYSKGKAHPQAPRLPAVPPPAAHLVEVPLRPVAAPVVAAVAAAAAAVAEPVAETVEMVATATAAAMEAATVAAAAPPAR